jgi:predicted RNase H-like nuclease (RuvC/YqgF family)
MPEISAQDLRRLRALEGRLAKARDETRSFSAERRELRARATAAERSARTAEKRAGDVADQLTALVEENAKLAARLDSIDADSQRLRAAAVKLREQLDEATASLKAAASEEKKLTRSLREAESERDRLGERLKLTEAQLETEATTPILPAKEVATLIDNFVGEIGAGLPGMVVRDGEIKLQVGFAKVGRATGFVVPSAGAPPDASMNLHEVAVRFDRTRDVAEATD